jgi:hypothetical protein
MMVRASLLWSCWVLVSACNSVTSIGSDCPPAGCPQSVECGAARQQLPTSCDRTAQSCSGLPIDDDVAACTACGLNNMRVRVENTAIAQCACQHCAVQLAACFGSSELDDAGDTSESTKCQVMVQCGWAAHCSGSECYCGVGVDRVACLQAAAAGHPAGPCANVIAAASGCADAENVGDCVLSQQLRPGTLLYRATELAQCVTGDPLLPNADITAQCPPAVFNPAPQR